MVQAVLTTDWNKIKNLADFERQWPSFSADVGISTLDNVFERPSCDSSISDLDDINDLVGYHELSGKYVSQLESADAVSKNDLFLVSQCSSGVYQSSKLTYQTLSSKLFYNIFENLKLKSMAYRESYEFAVSSHSHDDTYSQIRMHINPKYVKGKSEYVGDDNAVDVCSCWISTDMLSCSHDNKYESVSCNPAHATTDIAQHIWKIPRLKPNLPPKPMIGTIRFIGNPTLRKLVEGNGLVVVPVQTADGTRQTFQVNPYDDDGNIRDGYDGWVFANGTKIKNNSSALSAAATVYADSAESDFIVPCLDQFFKPNIGEIQQPNETQPSQVGLRKHIHQVGTHKFSGKIVLDRENTQMYSTSGTGAGKYVHQGDANKKQIQGIVKAPAVLNLNTSYLENVQTTACQRQNTEPYPKHQIIPIMIYIGGEIDAFYESI